MPRNRNHRRPPIAVVLGGGIRPDGKPADATLLRAQAAARLAAEHPEMKLIILSGNGPTANPRPVTEAEVMAAVLEHQYGICRSRLLLEDESIDTIGNAVLVAARYLHAMKPTRIFLVTSPFHMERALIMFRNTLGPAWLVEPYNSQPTGDDDTRAATEPGGIAWAQRFFADVKPGDLRAIIARLQSQKPYYDSLSWLQPCKFPHHCGVWHRMRCRLRKWSHTNDSTCCH